MRMFLLLATYRHCSNITRCAFYQPVYKNALAISIAALGTQSDANGFPLILSILMQNVFGHYISSVGDSNLLK